MITKAVTTECDNGSINEPRSKEQNEMIYFGSWEWNMQTGEISWSDEMYRIYGVEKETFYPCRASIKALTHPDESEKHIRKRIMSGINPIEAEYKIIRADGEARDLLAYINTQYDETGLPLSSSGTVQDITERKKMVSELTLRASLLEYVHDAIIAVDESMNITYWNEMSEKLTGWSASEVMGRHGLPYFEKMGVSSLFGEMTESLNLHGYFEMEVPAFSKDGTPLFIDLHMRRIYGPQGKFKGTISTIRDITERKKAEEALHESEERYRHLFENMLNGCAYCQMLLDEEGRPDDFVYLAVNTAFGRMTGLTNVIGKRVTQVLPQTKETNPELIEIYGRVASTGDPEKFEIHFKPLNLSLSISVYCPHKGFFVAVFEDITGRKWAEEELMTAKQRLEAHIDNSPLSFIEFDPAFRIIRWSKEAERMFGWKAEEILGKLVYEVKWVYEDDTKLVDKENEALNSGKAPRHMNVNRNYTKNGSVIWCEWYDSAIYDDNGKMISILSQVLDITERMRVEEALRESEAKTIKAIAAKRQQLYDVLETLPVMVCLISPDYHIVFANRTFREKFGDSGGRLCYNYCCGYTQPCTFCEAFVPIKTGQPHHWEFVHPKGNAVLDAYDFPFSDTDGSPLILEMNIDVTKRKNMEKELKKNAEELQQKNKLVTEFFTNISHEFKTPLSVILIQLELMRLYKGDPAKLEEFIAAATQNSYRLTRLVGNLLDITKIDAGYMKVNYSDADIVKIVEDISRSVRDFAKARSIQLQFKTSIQSKEMPVDAEKIERILLNLLSNAIKHTPKEGRITITVKERKAGGMDISVKDTGEGIPEDKLKTIFDRFAQVNTSLTRQTEGCGIGLALVKSLTEMMGGSIRVKSEVGKGSKFSIELPMIDASMQPKSIAIEGYDLNKKTAMELSDLLV